MSISTAVFLALFFQLVRIAVCEEEKKRDCYCGYRQHDDVINGSYITDTGKYPWLVALKAGGQCTGALISPSAVLTAAHCQPDGNSADAEMYFVGESGKAKKTFKVKQIINHPQYVNNQQLLNQHDISIWVMDGSVQCKGDTIPICIPEEDIGTEGLRAIIAGNGATEKDIAGQMVGRSNAFRAPRPGNPFRRQMSGRGFGNQMSLHGFGHQMSNNGFGHQMSKNGFGNQMSSNGFGNQMYGKGFGRYNNGFGGQMSNKGYGRKTANNGFGGQMSNKGFGNQMSNNGFGFQMSNNRFGNQMSNRYGRNMGFGGQMFNKGFGNQMSNNGFGNQMSNKGFGRSTANNGFGGQMSNNRFGFMSNKGMGHQMSNTKFGNQKPSNGYGNQMTNPGNGRYMPKNKGVMPNTQAGFKPQMNSNGVKPQMQQQESQQGDFEQWKMKEGLTTIVNRNLCNTAAVNTMPEGSAYCTKETEDSTICWGDSGSSMFVKKDDVFYSLGTASGGAVNACQKDALTLFTNVFFHRDFIVESVPDLATPLNVGALPPIEEPTDEEASGPGLDDTPVVDLLGIGGPGADFPGLDGPGDDFPGDDGPGDDFPGDDGPGGDDAAEGEEELEDGDGDPKEMLNGKPKGILKLMKKLKKAQGILGMRHMDN